MISEHLEVFAGRPVKEFSAGDALRPGEEAYRLSIDWERHQEGVTITDLIEEFLGTPGASDVEALVIGDWGGTGEGNSSERLVEALVAARDLLPRLTALFIGDMTSEESEISWINQSDMSPIWAAFPGLVEFGVRGGSGLDLGRPSLPQLRKFVIEAGGLPRGVVQEVIQAQLPALEHLELWLGDGGYGGDATVEDVKPLLEAGRFPKLRYLGLRNSEISDEIAAALQGATILGQLEVLDLSLGTFSDVGAEALAANAALRQLKKLDIHHHYVSPEGVNKLNTLGIEIDASDAREPDKWGDGESHRYVFASE